MATTLVIKSGSFSTNALDTVTFGDEIPCTGISLDNSTLSVNYGSTGTLTATASPENTTDLITWSSSDETVATVSNGTVTPVGVGSTTITATCGEYSDTCTVTVSATMNTTNLLERVGYNMSGNAIADSGNGIPTWSTATGGRGGLASSTGTLSYYSVEAYPYVVPNNTAKLKITIKSGSKLALNRIQWFNKDTALSSYPTTASLLMQTLGNTLTPTTDGQGNSVYTVTLPTNTPVINAFAIGLETKDYSDMTTTMLDDITVEFLAS